MQEGNRGPNECVMKNYPHMGQSILEGKTEKPPYVHTALVPGKMFCDSRNSWSEATLLRYDEQDRTYGQPLTFPKARGA